MSLFSSRYFNKNLYSWFIAGMIGLITAYVFTLQYFDLIEIKQAKAALIFILFLLLGTSLAYFLFFKFAFPRAVQYIESGSKVLVWFAGMLLAGLFLAVVYPARLPAAYAQANLEIETTGKMNPAASESKIILLSLTRASGQPVDLTAARLGNQWKFQDGQITTSNKKPSSRLHFKTSRTDTYTLEFITSPSSGIVKIIWNGTEQAIDLYRLMPGVYNLQVSPNRLLLYLLKPYWISAALLIGMILFVLSVFLTTRRWVSSKTNQPASKPVSPRLALVYALPMTTVWTITLLTFWPGLMSYDSLDQWSQMVTGQYNDVNPAFHTLTNWLITRIYLSPATIALFQILSLSLAIGWGLYLLRKAGVPKQACLLSLTLFVFSPVNNTLAITLWKDIPYAISLLVLSLLIFLLSITNGEWLQKPFAWLMLGLTTALVSLFRHNGLPVAIACLIILVIVYKHLWRQIAFTTLSLLIVFLTVRGPLYKWAKVDTSQDRFHLGIRLLHYFAAYANSDVRLDHEGLSVQGRIWPSKDPLPYDCYLMDTTATRVSRDAIVDNFNDLQHVLIRLIKEKPGVAVRHQLCANSIVWEISQPEKGYFYAYELSNYMNNKYDEFRPGLFSIKIQSILPKVQPLYVNLIETTRIWPIWRPALYLYLSVFCGVIFALRRRSWKYALFLLPIIFHSLVLFLINATQEVRYQYPVYLVSLLSLALIFVDRPDRKISDMGSNTTA